MLIGAIGGLVFVFLCRVLEKYEIDDVVLAIPVHLGCGLWGVVAVGLFSAPLDCQAAFGVDTCGTVLDTARLEL